MAAPKKVNYLNNKDILKEIHKSKMSFCWLSDEKYFQNDIILDDVKSINKKTILEAKQNQASRIQSEAYAVAMIEHGTGDYRNKPKQKEFAVDLDTISDEDVTFRVMSMEHIPLEPGRKKNPRNEAEIKEVARSHWQGSLSNGEFNPGVGRITNKLGTMFLKLVERFSHRANWRGYTYVDEMRGQALVQLSQVGLQFNEAKSDNPFAYYTAAVINSFTRVLNLEKRNQSIRDDILIDTGHLPSYSRQIKHEDEMRILRESIESGKSDEGAFE